MSTALLWIVGGFVLIILEFFLTSFIVVFFGFAAVLTGIALWGGLSESSGIPYILFAALSLVMLFGLRARFQDWLVGDIASDNDSDDDFIGSEVEIVSGFDEASPGRGRVSYRGAQWDARSATEELIKGSYARIISRHSAVLTIEPGE